MREMYIKASKSPLQTDWTKLLKSDNTNVSEDVDNKKSHCIGWEDKLGQPN